MRCEDAMNKLSQLTGESDPDLLVEKYLESECGPRRRAEAEGPGAGPPPSPPAPTGQAQAELRRGHRGLGPRLGPWGLRHLRWRLGASDAPSSLLSARPASAPPALSLVSLPPRLGPSEPFLLCASPSGLHLSVPSVCL